MIARFSLVFWYSPSVLYSEFCKRYIDRAKLAVLEHGSSLFSLRSLDLDNPIIKCNQSYMHATCHKESIKMA